MKRDNGLSTCIRAMALLLAVPAVGIAGGAQAAETFAKAKVLVLYPFLGDQSYLREYNSSIATALNYPGAKITVKAGPSRSNVEFFLEEIGNAAANGYNVVAVNTGGVSKQLINAVNQAQTDGVKTVSFDGSPPDSPAVASVINYDNFGAAGVAGKQFLALLPKGGEIGVIRCLAGLPDTDAFINGFTAAVKGSSLKVVNEGDAKCDPAKSRTIAENMLSAHPDIIGIYDSVDVSAQGSLQAVKAAGSQAVIGSIGGQEYALKAIAAGDANWKFTVPYPFEVIGQTAVDVAVKVALGDKVDHDVLIPPQPMVTAANAEQVLTAVHAATVKAKEAGGQAEVNK